MRRAFDLAGDELDLGEGGLLALVHCGLGHPGLRGARPRGLERKALEVDEAPLVHLEMHLRVANLQRGQKAGQGWTQMFLKKGQA